MTKAQKIAASLIGSLLVLALGTGVALANPSYFATGVTTNSAASTTPAYMTPGAATSTTPVYDAYAQKSAGVSFKATSVGMLQIFCGSSTNAVLNNAVEYSADGIDWYRNYVLDSSQTGTTTTPWAVGTPFSQTWKFASSSVGGVIGVATCSTAATVLPAPFRYIRVVSSLMGANGSAWTQLVPVKEQP